MSLGGTPAWGNKRSYHGIVSGPPGRWPLASRKTMWTLESQREIRESVARRIVDVSPVLSVASLEVLHEGDQRVYALLREGVVDGGADAADRPMPLQPVEPRSGRFLDESLLQVLAAHAERDVHQRPAALVRGSAIEAGAINFGIDLRRLPFVGRGDSREAALREQPFHHQAERVHGKRGGRVVQRSVLRMHRVVEHGGHRLLRALQEILSD